MVIQNSGNVNDAIKPDGKIYPMGPLRFPNIRYNIWTGHLLNPIHGQEDQIDFAMRDAIRTTDLAFGQAGPLNLRLQFIFFE